MKLIFTTIFLFNFFNAPLLSAGDILKGFEAYNEGDYSRAYSEWESLANEGDVIAQSSLGIMYHLGQGVDKNDKTAFELFSLSARQGFAPAQMSLGNMYENGFGTTTDMGRAFMWYYISASADDSGTTMLKLIKEKMNDTEIKKSTNLAMDCIDSHLSKC